MAGVGDIQWCHAISKDYASWEHLPDALPAGSFSGGATQLSSGDIRMLYKDVHKGNRYYTSSPANLSDPHLVSWIEASKPTTMTPGTDPSAGFRGTPGGPLYALVGIQAGNGSGGVRLFKANDNFTNVTDSGHNLFQFSWDFIQNPQEKGKLANDPVPRDPNFYPVSDSGGKVFWVLQGAMKLCSGGGNDFYSLGDFDEATGRLIPLDPMRTMSADPYDFGHARK